jgi:hypothetical protein
MKGRVLLVGLRWCWGLDEPSRRLVLHSGCWLLVVTIVGSGLLGKEMYSTALVNFWKCERCLANWIWRVRYTSSLIFRIQFVVTLSATIAVSKIFSQKPVTFPNPSTRKNKSTHPDFPHLPSHMAPRRQNFHCIALLLIKKISSRKSEIGCRC